jgi:hypothetical protein
MSRLAPAAVVVAVGRYDRVSSSKSDRDVSSDVTARRNAPNRCKSLSYSEPWLMRCGGVGAALGERKAVVALRFADAGGGVGVGAAPPLGESTGAVARFGEDAGPGHALLMVSSRTNFFARIARIDQRFGNAGNKRSKKEKN